MRLIWLCHIWMRNVDVLYEVNLSDGAYHCIVNADEDKWLENLGEMLVLRRLQLFFGRIDTGSNSTTS